MTAPVSHYRPVIDLDDRTVLVTGGTGSFGRAFVRRVLDRHRPRRLIVFSRDELKQYEMAQGLSVKDHPALRYFIGDVRDFARLEMAMKGVDYVVHAAALKHVPIAEYNPFECVQTNIVGTENVVRAAMRTGVQRLIALSSDKAVSPINLYGATKLAADKIVIAANNLTGGSGQRFAVARYGNVINSRGSVVPLFRRLLAEGCDSLPITDPRMTRFWITLSQAVDFVLSCIATMHGGEIFVPKIPSMKITELAAALAPDKRQHTIGIRPGEKLHEALITADDARDTVDLGDRYVIEPALAMWDRQSFRDDGATPVAEGFQYTSDRNGQWLERRGLAELLAESAA